MGAEAACLLLGDTSPHPRGRRGTTSGTDSVLAGSQERGDAQRRQEAEALVTQDEE